MSFKITGPGAYATRSGHKAYVVARDPWKDNLWIGSTEDSTLSWYDSGNEDPYYENSDDLIDVWKEPVKEPVVVRGWAIVSATGRVFAVWNSADEAYTHLRSMPPSTTVVYISGKEGAVP